MAEKEKYLNMISVAYYVVGALAGLAACIPILHLVVGVGMLFTGATADQSPDTAPFLLMGGFFTVIALAAILIGWAYAIGLLMTGRFIAQRKRHTFCVIMSAIACIFMPFGTVLGVLSLILLLSSDVQALFNAPQPYE